MLRALQQAKRGSAALKEELAAARGSLDEVTAARDAALQRLEVLSGEADGLQKSLDACQTELAAERTSVEELGAELESTQDALAEAEGRAVSVEAQATASVAAAQARIQELEAAVDAGATERDALQQKVSRSRTALCHTPHRH